MNYFVEKVSKNDEKYNKNKDFGRAHFLQQRGPFGCPVCGGRGFGVSGFYSLIGNTWVTTSTIPETCRSCQGTGVVWSD